MPCFEQAVPVFGGVAEDAGMRVKISKKERPIIPFFMSMRLKED